jgi:hypothetical protein
MKPEPTKTEFSSYTPEELSELYKTDPEYFEELADNAIRQACCGSTPEQTIKRRQFQWTIDAQLQVAKSPLERMHIMENIFYSRVYGAEGNLAQLMDRCTDLIRALGAGDRVPEQVPRVASKKPALYLVKK